MPAEGVGWKEHIRHQTTQDYSGEHTAVYTQPGNRVGVGWGWGGKRKAGECGSGITFG